MMFRLLRWLRSRRSGCPDEGSESRGPRPMLSIEESPATRHITAADIAQFGPSQARGEAAQFGPTNAARYGWRSI